ncbi:plasmid partitioning protein [Sinorhizobium fredii USDA 205]|uniref:Plasmid partitioning protein RepB n=1 Tax=Rhizobium fredii TaxID=380 RepID=A0A844A5M3_RHIFR|nr:plasmid partitioning protein RepB [Sinorhizobium fredii]ASY71380.1 Plasmid replication protein RepB [Sinorhizobium fredii CCBAU 83666]KSV88684.1 plasmid partitioning protein [Sinorhizobium fredii USDA 205]MQX07060.1 plasmid partitioning protein RepB [Sinorhizobium fredii]MQX08419.1 plasmid partitioning protein RepB [Sinorhizobium fredii]GEC34647.1 plasmid partitioning protein RepB [Sinorhizobium fredii]
MARKNLIGISDSPAAPLDGERPAVERPIAGVSPGHRTNALVGGITRSLSNITQKVERAEELERQLAQGQAIVELDPSLIDASFIIDRLGVTPEAQAALVQQIRDHGQQVPILVRPHPGVEHRYQVAYGHRRLAALREIGGKVRAVVRELSDEQLVISQGQENNARTDLSYVERALFAARLEDRGFSRETIMSALGVDKAALSKMISVVRRLPVEVIEAIGAAPSFGRRRWMELADRLENDGRRTKALTYIRQGPFTEMDSDRRFEKLFIFLAEARGRARAEAWLAPDRTRPVRIRDNDTETTLAFNKTAAPGFAEFVRQRLEALYLEYQQETGD